MLAEKNYLYDLGMTAMQQEQVPLELSHLFADGLYGRILTVPANTLVMTAIHKYENITIVLTGKCEVVNPDGERTTIVAPAFFVTPARSERAVYVIEKTTWITVHASNSKTVEDAEMELAELPAFFQDVIEQQKQESLKCH